MPNDNTTPAITRRYYPTLASIVSEDDFPEILGFIKDGILTLLDKIHYKDLQYNKSSKGDAAFYSLSIVSPNRIDIEIPGTGMFLVLNPDLTGGDSNISAFPITIDYEWVILAYLRDFDLNNFSFTPQEFFEIALRVLNISEEQAIANFINTFTEPVDASTTSLEQFVNDINEFNDGVNLLTPTQETKLVDVVTEIYEQTNKYATLIGFATYILKNDLQETKEKLKEFFRSLLPDDIEEYIRDILLPKMRATLTLTAGIEFPRSILKPVYDETHPDSPYEVIPEIDDQGNPKVILTFGEALFYADTEKGFGYNMELVFNTTVPAQIGNTGLIVDIENLKIDLSREENITEADLDNRPPDFMGAYMDYAAIILPKRWFNNVDETTLKLAGRNLLVGTGGISGTIALEAVGGGDIPEGASLPVKIGNWELAFKSFDITFQQSAVTSSNIAGSLTIPKLKNDDGEQAILDINGHLYEDGDFHLTASEPEGISRNLFNFIRVTFLSLELGKDDDNFFIGSSCRLKFINPIMDKILQGQEIDISRLRIYDNGSIEIEGGAIPLPQNISLNLGPVEIAVTAIHFGSHQQEHDGIMRSYNYWGFDGAISLDPLGIDARGEGIKYYYTTDNEEMAELYGGNEEDYRHNFLRVQTIEVDLVIPGTASPETAVALIHGMVSIPEPGDSPEYIGEVSLKLPKAKISGGAALRLQPRHPAFLLDAFVDFPAPIPLGPLGIYGFRGLLGFRYVAEKEAVGLTSEDTWYDYYTYPERGVGIQKFSGPERTADYNFPFSIGAGAVLGTSFDSGTVLSMRMMMLLSMPSMFMLDGRASILVSRLGLDDTREPPFFFFTILGDNSLEFGMGADFQLPQDNGWILDLQAEVQAGFFFNNPRAWYVNFGTRDNPITARVLTIVTAQTYLMLSATGIEAGSRIEIDIRKRFGPARVRIYAYLEMGGFISFERPQIGGYLALGGMIDINIWIVGVTIGLDALFSVEAARPFLIYAEIRLRVCVRIIFKVCKSFTIKMKWEKNGQVNRDPIAALPYQNAQYSVDRTEELVQAVHMLTNESFALTHKNNWVRKDQTSIWEPSHTLIDKVIPLDSYVDIKAVKGLIPNAISSKIGGHTGGADNFTGLIPPQKVVRGGREIRQVKHKYSIEDIEIKAWTGSSWMNYHPYEALVPEDYRDQVSNLRIGYWQRKGNQYDAIRLLATNPFSYVEAGEPGWVIPEEYGVTASELFCEGERKLPDCADVLNKPLGTVYYPPTQYIGHQINGPYFTLDGEYATTVTQNQDGTQTISISEDNFRVSDADNNFNYAQSLEFDNGNSLVIILPEPSTEANLRLTTDAVGVTITYYESQGLVDNTTVYTEIHEVYKTKAQLQQQVEFDTEDLNNPEVKYISKIVIEPSSEGGSSTSDNFCSDYDQLNQLYQNCFVPVETSAQVDAGIPCFNQFGSLVQAMIVAYELPTNVSAEYNNYTYWLGLIEGLVGHHEQILRFRNLDSSALKLLNLLQGLGGCNCSPCEVLDLMEQHFGSCFTLSANPTMKQLDDATACLEDILNIVNCEDTVEPPKDLNKSISFNYNSSETQSGQAYVFNLTQLTSGNSSTNGVQKIRIISLPNRGELGIIDNAITSTPTEVTAANINSNLFYFWPTDTDGNGTPGDFTTLFQFMIVDNSGNDTDLVKMTINANDTYVPGLPSLTQISNTSTGPGGTRTQVFEVGDSVSPGNKFRLTVYSYTNTVTAVAGDTPFTIAWKLRNAINSTTLAQWDTWGSAPPNGTNGYPPTATASGNKVTIVLNFQNQFAASASVS
jgi:hypothetical protein